MTREEKIALLQKIESGKLRLNELKIKSIVIICNQDGTYNSTLSESIMSEEEMQTFIENMHFILFLPDNGRN